MTKGEHTEKGINWQTLGSGLVGLAKAGSKYLPKSSSDIYDKGNGKDVITQPREKGIFGQTLRSGLAAHMKEGSKYFVKHKPDGRWSVYSKTIRKGKDAIIRFDTPHGKSLPSHHININPRISGVKDPHLNISPTAFKASGQFARCLEFMNKVNEFLTPVVLTMDAIEVGCAVCKDVEQKTSKNTTVTVARIGSAWGGGFGGASLGAKIGTFIFPGVGTILGGVIGGIAGGIGASKAAEIAIENLENRSQHDQINSK